MMLRVKDNQRSPIWLTDDRKLELTALMKDCGYEQPEIDRITDWREVRLLNRLFEAEDKVASILRLLA